MSDELLPYYARELKYIQDLGSEFGKSHPKIAERLRLSDGTSEDPHVARLIQSFAFLNARIRHKLDDDFPEITDAFLNVLYPHYLAPIPSMAIVQFDLDPAQGPLKAGYAIPKDAALETEPIEGERCQFRTGYPVMLWPLEVTSAEIMGHPFTAPRVRGAEDAVAILRLQIACTIPETSLSELEFKSLRFFINGSGTYIYDFYEALFNDVMNVALTIPGAREPISLGRDCLAQVGFDSDQGMLPYSARSFPGYRLLTEFFAFPAKFLFFDLKGFERLPRDHAEGTLEAFIFLRRTSSDLERYVSADTLRLGCAPVVNLFTHRAEPMRLDHTVTENRVVAGARRPRHYEVYSIDRVRIRSAGGETEECRPFYSSKHAWSQDESTPFWYMSRRPNHRASDDLDDGTDVFLTLVQLDYSEPETTDGTLDVETTCLNRNLPRQLPFGGGQPHLTLTDGGPISRIQCLTHPTPTLRLPQGHGAYWRLISHLTLNQLSIGGDSGVDALREILKLYDYSDSPETQTMIDGVTGVESRRVVARTTGEINGGVCRGVEMTIEFDEERFTGSGVFLMASVLERFLGLYSSVNSFSQMVAKTRQRQGVLHRWSPRAGERVLL